MSRFDYHTALQSKNFSDFGIKGIKYFKSKKCVGFQYDFVESKSLSKEYDNVDFFYVEAPYPKGIKIFDERAKVKKQRGIEDFAKALNSIITKTEKPFAISTSKHLHNKLPTPKMRYQIKAYICELTFAIYNWEKNIQFKTTEQLMKYVAYNYKCVGDFCCGYGQPLFDFLKYGGQKIVASDHNDLCISVLKEKMENYEKNI